MFYRPKKVNKGFDRIFMIIAIIGMLFGFYLGIYYYDRIKTVTEKPFWPNPPPILMNEIKNKWGNPDIVVIYIIDKFGENDQKAVDNQLNLYLSSNNILIVKKELEEYINKRREAERQIAKRKNELLIGGHQTWEEIDYRNKLIGPTLYVYPTMLSCIIAGILFSIVSFTFIMFILRGIALLVIWIKQGFNEQD
jgi:hypothetical protein